MRDRLRWALTDASAVACLVQLRGGV